MSIYTEVKQFVQAHRPCGDLTWWTTPATPQGYQVLVSCPCGVIFERWVLPQDAEEDLLRSGLPCFPQLRRQSGQGGDGGVVSSLLVVGPFRKPYRIVSNKPTMATISTVGSRNHSPNDP